MKFIEILLMVIAVGAFAVLGYATHPNQPFYLPAAVALFSTLMVVINTNPVHALLYLVLSLLAVAAVFFALGAPFAAALEVIVYAGAIMVLFVFVVMLLNVGPGDDAQEREWLKPRNWIGPGAFAALLLAQLFYVFSTPAGFVGPEMPLKGVGIALHGPYLLAVELASMLLLAGLIAAYHIGRKEGKS